jgi:maleate isomerase
MAHLNVRNLPVTKTIDAYKKIGMLTPSSNSTLEPVCSRMLANVPQAVCLYGRIPVTKITLEKDVLKQFDFAPMLQASELLAHAEVDVIAWNGTSGAWLGFDVDRELCRLIKEKTGAPATTSMLAQLEAFKLNNVKKIHLVAPYQQDVMERMICEYSKAGVEVVNAEACGYSNVKAMRNTSDEIITSMLDAVTKAPADGISVVCTAFPLVHKIDFYEKKYNCTIYDTIPVVLWKSLKMVGVDTKRVKGWGRLFDA